MNFPEWFQHAGISSILDMALMSLLIYTMLVWFKSRRAGAVLTGIVIIAVVYLLIRQFNLLMTARVFEQFFAVILIALVVIFQEELRHLFEQVAIWSLNRRLRGRKKPLRLTREEVDVLVRTMGDLAREKIGVLIVLKGKNLIVRHLDGGIDLNGVLSEQLLKSLFDPHSIGHDGAAVIEGNRVAQFGCHLPLSKNLQKIGKGGTRHTAALGLSELTDALCLVVSEERGTISVARNGNLQVVPNLEKLSLILEGFYAEISPKNDKKIWREFIKRNWREKIVATSIAMGLWFVLIHASELTYRTYTIPVTHEKMPNELKLKFIEPKEIDLTFRGPRRAFFFLTRDDIKTFIKIEPKYGTQRIHLAAKNLIYPQNIVLDDIQPNDLHVVVENRPPEEKKPEPLQVGILEKIAEKTKEMLPAEAKKEVTKND